MPSKKPRTNVSDYKDRMTAPVGIVVKTKRKGNNTKKKGK